MEKDFLMIYSPLQLASSFPSNVNTRLLPEDSHLHHKYAPWGLALGYHFVSSGSNHLVRFVKHPQQTITGGDLLDGKRNGCHCHATPPSLPRCATKHQHLTWYNWKASRHGLDSLTFLSTSDQTMDLDVLLNYLFNMKFAIPDTSQF